MYCLIAVWESNNLATYVQYVSKIEPLGPHN